MTSVRYGNQDHDLALYEVDISWRGDVVRYLLTYSMRVSVTDFDGQPVSEDIIRKLDGIACHDDHVLNYTQLPFVEECALRGGYPRLMIDDKCRLLITVEIDSLRKLKPKEIKSLREEFEGQLTDGIGAGCFDRWLSPTGLSIEVLTSPRGKSQQSEGRAWQPKATTPKGNERRVAGVEKILSKLDAQATPETPRANKKSKTQANPKSKNKQKPSDSSSKSPPNYRKLLRLLDKLERDSLFDEIKAEVESCGGDLSMIKDGQFPYGNFNSSKLLRMLLKAGLNPEMTDTEGNSLLIQSAGSPQCLKLLLEQGADVNRYCGSIWLRQH